MNRPAIPREPSITNVMVIKRGSAMKKQSRLHNYAPVTLVLTHSSLMYFHEDSKTKPACTIPLSAVISATIVSEPSISFYYGISQECSFDVGIGDRSFKFRVESSETASSWASMIMAAKEGHILETGRDNPLVITNTAGDNTDGTKFWRTKPVGYVENFNAAIDTISSAISSVAAVGKSGKEKDSGGLSRTQIEALLTFERLICLNEIIAQRVATAFFALITARAPPRGPRSRHQERIISEENCNISRLLGHSIAHWLIHAPTAAANPTANPNANPEPEKHIIDSSKTSTTTVSGLSTPTLNSTIPINRASMQRAGSISSSHSLCSELLHPPRTMILQFWLESCVLHEFHRFSSRAMTEAGTLSRHTKMPFRSNSITGLFVA